MPMTKGHVRTSGPRLQRSVGQVSPLWTLMGISLGDGPVVCSEHMFSTAEWVEIFSLPAFLEIARL